MRPVLRTMALAGCLLSLSACVYDPAYEGGYVRSDRVYRDPDAYAARSVYLGRVTDVREVVVGRERSGAGVVLGAIAGGLIGSTIGGGSGRALATVGGAIAGGAIGDRVEHDHSRRWALEVSVVLDRGDHVVVLQDFGADLRPGDRVRVVGWGRDARVMRD